MTLSLAAVFIPVLFMGGIIGRLFHEFAVVIMVAILISGFVSLSLTPMLCSRFLKPPHGAITMLCFAPPSESSTAFAIVYGWTLRGVVRHRFITLMVAVGNAGGHRITCIAWSPPDSFPNQDTGQIQGTTELPQDASFDAMVKSQHEAAAIVQADPNVEGVFSTVNASGGNNGANAGRIFMRLKPRTQRKLTPEQIIDELRPKLDTIPGMRTYLDQSAADPHRRAAEPQSVSVHAAGPGPERTVSGVGKISKSA